MLEEKLRLKSIGKGAKTGLKSWGEVALYHTRRQRAALVTLKLLEFKGNLFASLVCVDNTNAGLPFPLIIFSCFRILVFYCDGLKHIISLQESKQKYGTYF